MPSYIVKLKTADQADAGTDSNIFLQMQGVKGSMPEAIRLNELISGDAFERGSTTVVTLNPGDLGPIAKIRIRSDGRHPGSDWRLSFVDIRYMDAAAEQKAAQLLSNSTNIINTLVEVAKLGVTTRFLFNRVITGAERDPQTGEEGVTAFAENLVSPLGEPQTGTVLLVRAFVVNALESATEGRQPFREEARLENHLMIGREVTNRAQIAAEVGWEVPVKGVKISGKLSTEFEQIRAEKEEQFRAFTIGRTVDFDLIAKPRTAQIEIRRHSVEVAAQNFHSSLSGPFAARWVIASMSEVPVITSFTLEKGRNMDTAWNDQIAMPLFLARPQEYDGFVATFKAAGILKNVKPLPGELRQAA